MNNLPNEELGNDLLKRCEEAKNKGITRFKGMSYEQGVLHGIRWMLGLEEYDPLDGPEREFPGPMGPFGDESEGKIVVVAVADQQLNAGLHS